MTKKDQLTLIKDDPWLEPYSYEIQERQNRFYNTLNRIEKNQGGLLNFASKYKDLGIHYSTKAKGWCYREWAPLAQHLALVGDFNNWENNSHPLTKQENGIWEIIISDPKKELLSHLSRIKVVVTGFDGSTKDRIPAYIRRVVQDPETHDFAGQVYEEEVFNWTEQNWKTGKIKTPIIYECHIGMAQEKEGVGTFDEFRKLVLPRIVKGGYNCIQLMAIAEHPYYGSFGYHVSNYFAVSSRFGSAKDFKSLVNECHQLGIAVIIDLVHSHAVKNISEGLNDFDGSGHQYFHEGYRGDHPGWDSKLFNYGKTEVLQFLLSNVHFWMVEFHVDGFRFDGVTSMLYHHHGEGAAFDHYDQYFKYDVDHDAVTYLQLANHLIHSINPQAISIAEDMSGMPGLCRKITEGGMDFDYRLAMGIPDYWIKLLKHSSDEEWDINQIWNTLTNRRHLEKTISYAESHDQALVGDKTLAFWLMDKEMYFHMLVKDQNVVIDRGISLHKMIRLVTIALGGDAYLNFIGNEFGHPEWVDFPREGNDWSYLHARRQWSLVDNDLLKYKFMNDFDQAMVKLIDSKDVLKAAYAEQLHMDSHAKVMIFRRNRMIFLFNFNPTESFADYTFITNERGSFRILLNSDAAEFGGHERLDSDILYPTFDEADGTTKMRFYLPSRTAIVIAKI